MKYRIGLFGLLAIAALAAPASAQVVYDNGSYIGGADGRNISNFAIADDFITGSALSFNAIRFFAFDTTAGLLSQFSGTLA